MTNLADLAALRGKREEALADMEWAIDHGFTRYDETVNDEHLKSLREDPRYKALLEKLRQAAAKSSQN